MCEVISDNSLFLVDAYCTISSFSKKSRILVFTCIRILVFRFDHKQYQFYVYLIKNTVKPLFWILTKSISHDFNTLSATSCRPYKCPISGTGHYNIKTLNIYAFWMDCQILIIFSYFVLLPFPHSLSAR